MKELSIIIPVLNEQQKICRDIKRIEEFFRKEDIDGELIIVDDGSSDNTVKNAEKYRQDSDTVKIISLKKHTGKGAAVREGIRGSSGEYVMFTDAGECVPVEFIKKGLDILKRDECDILHGSRRLKDSVISESRGPVRKFYSTFFLVLIRLFSRSSRHLTDTQCGFKMYKGKIARELYSESSIDGFMFDIEIIKLAREKGFRIKELPLKWNIDKDSRLKPIRHLPAMIKELSKIKRK